MVCYNVEKRKELNLSSLDYGVAGNLNPSF